METGLRGTRAEDDESTPLDPVALTLAVWLGLMVCAAGLARLSANMPAPGTEPDAAALPLPMALGFGV